VRGQEIAFVADPLDALLLQVQGSGRLRVTEADGRERLTRLAYAGHNDHAYRSVGRWLIEQGELRSEEASWQAIRDWARRYPERVNELVWSNPRIVFFREEPLLDEGAGPRGAQGVVLSPGRSVAVDPLALPYGAVLWLDSTEPLTATPLRRVVMAGHRQRHHRRGAHRLLLGLGRTRRTTGRTHETAIAPLGVVAALRR
jgi:membrane-bound lytic murein transglycosylase A